MIQMWPNIARLSLTVNEEYILSDLKQYYFVLVSEKVEKLVYPVFERLSSS
jgi:hypothetical protein